MLCITCVTCFFSQVFALYSIPPHTMVPPLSDLVQFLGPLGAPLDKPFNQLSPAWFPWQPQRQQLPPSLSRLQDKVTSPYERVILCLAEEGMSCCVLKKHAYQQCSFSPPSLFTSILGEARDFIIRVGDLPCVSLSAHLGLCCPLPSEPTFLLAFQCI